MRGISLKELLWAGRLKFLTILVILVAIGLGRLGLWQYSRHLERSGINQRINKALASAPVSLAELLRLPEAEREYHRLTLTGSYEQKQILWRNRAYRGGTGYHILSVLRSDDGRVVLVDRGWIPYEAGVGDSWQTAFPVPTGPQTIAAVWRFDQEARTNTPESSTTKWFAIDTTAIGKALDVTLLAGFAQNQPAEAAGQPVDLPYPAVTTDMGLGSHLGYTFQWFAFAVILLVGYVVVQLRRLRALAH